MIKIPLIETNMPDVSLIAQKNGLIDPNGVGGEALVKSDGSGIVKNTYTPPYSAAYTKAPASLAGEVSAAKGELDAWKSSRPAEYVPVYGKEISELMKSLVGDDFSYDGAKDPLFALLRDESIKNARLAMEDTVGKAVSLSGGYMNSFAQSAGQQAYSDRMSDHHEYIPSLYEAAYERYSDEKDRLYDAVKLYSSLEDSEFDRYTDIMKQYLSEGELLSDIYSSLQKEEFDRFLDYSELMIKATK